MNSPIGSTPSVAIVGGGWAGMAAAAELASKKIPVTVFEAARTLGGRARRVETRGVALDNGLHILIGAYSETLRLIDQVRQVPMSRLLVRQPLTLNVEPRFRMRAPHLPRPLHTAAALLFARGLTLKDKFAAVQFMRSMQAGAYHCPAGTTVSRLLTAHNQPGNLIDYLWAPLCLSALNTPHERADAQTFLNVLRDSLAGPRSASDLLLPRVDFSSLFPEPAADYVRSRGGHVITGETVASVRPVRQGFEVAASTTKNYSHVIIAVGPHRLEKLAERIEGLSAPVEMVRRFEYEPIYSVYLQYDSSVRLPGPMIGIRGSGMGGNFAQWVFDRGQLCGQSGMLAVVISASGPHQNIPHDELAEAVHREIQARFLLPQPKWHQVIAEKRATFACVPDLQRPSNRTAVPDLLIAGDYTEGSYPATLEGAVRSGIACARAIAKDDD